MTPPNVTSDLRTPPLHPRTLAWLDGLRFDLEGERLSFQHETTHFYGRDRAGRLARIAAANGLASAHARRVYQHRRRMAFPPLRHGGAP